MTCKRICRIALMATCLLCMQVGLAGLPNIETVSISLIAYTMVFGLEAIWVAEVFAGLEVLVWGAGIWNLCYLYVWVVLVLITLLFKRIINRRWWLSVLVNSLFGLIFGALCSLVYLAGGLSAAYTWWLAGLSFDLVHCAGNFATAIVLYLPLTKVLRRIKDE